MGMFENLRNAIFCIGVKVGGGGVEHCIFIYFEYKIEILSFKSLFSCFQLKLDTQFNTNCKKTDMKISTQFKDKTKFTGGTFTNSFCVVNW